MNKRRGSIEQPIELYYMIAICDGDAFVFIVESKARHARRFLSFTNRKSIKGGFARADRVFLHFLTARNINNFYHAATRSE